MTIARRLSTVGAVLALGSGLGALIEPAHAATTPVVTVTVQDHTNPTHPRYGDFVGVLAEAKGPDGQYLSGGDVQIQMAAAGSSAWRDVGDGVGSHTSYSLASLEGPVQFRAVYSGGTSGSPQVTYAAATSAPAIIATVDRGKALVRSTRKQICYRVGPAPYRNKDLTFYAKLGTGKSWRPAGTVRTDENSEYCYRVAHPATKVTGPKLRAFKIVYAKSGGMKKSVAVRTY